MTLAPETGSLLDRCVVLRLTQGPCSIAHDFQDVCVMLEQGRAMGDADEGAGGSLFTRGDSRFRPQACTAADEPCYDGYWLGLRLGLLKCPKVSAASSRLAEVQSSQSKPSTRPRASYFWYARLAMSSFETDLTAVG